MNYDDENEGYSLENSLAASTDFKYPDDGGSPERYFDVGTVDVLIRLSTLLFATPKPKMVLAALLYSCGVDVGIYLSCANTETEIAKALGESKQNFHLYIDRACADFNLKHTNTGKSKNKTKVYKQTNGRKSKAK